MDSFKFLRMKNLAQIFVLLFCILFAPQSSAATPLSNLLPVDLVRAMVNDHAWLQEFDQANSPEAQDMEYFWNSLRQEQESLPVLMDSLFGAAQPQTNISLPKLYPAKVHMVRYLLTTQNNARMESVRQAWMVRYLELTLSTVQMANIPELQPIVQSFRAKLKRKEIKIYDLAPQERARLQKNITKNHGASITARDTSTGQYLVTGAYNAEQNYFAVDFARPLEETLITFVHEMVHAADPALDAWGNQYRKLLPKVTELVAHSLGKSPDTASLALDVIDHLLYETDSHSFKDIADGLRSQRIEQLRQSLANNPEASEEFSTADIQIIKEWQRAIIGLTTENEYRAYGYSILLYAVMRAQFQVLPPSKDRQEFVERFLSGDSVVATNLSLSANPYRSIRSQVFQQYLSPATAPRNKETYDRQARIAKTLDTLELIYLEETEAFLRSLSDKIAKQLGKINIEMLKAPGVLPGWAQPGGFDLPTNPLQILSARITTAWVLRFRQNMDQVVTDLKSFNSAFLAMRYGILDLHDISRGERKLIGISFENSPWASDPAELDNNLRQDLDSIPANISKYFQMVRWSPENVLKGDYIDGPTVSQNLLRLRTLKSASWLDQSFPPMRISLLGVKTFLQKLREGIFKPEEISPDRVAALEKELIQIWDVAGISRDELFRLRTLHNELSRLVDVANDSNWLEIARSFQEKSRFVLETMDIMGVSAKETLDSIEESHRNISNSFYSTLAPYKDRCESNSNGDAYRLAGFWPENGPFALGENKFPLTIVCYKSDLYLVRQPGDFLKYMTTMIRDGSPEARIFIGARPVRLTPVRWGLDSGKSKASKKEKKCFLFFCSEGE